jgi:hypothetical protein
MSVSSYINKEVNGVIGGVTGAAGSILGGAASAVGSLFDGVSGAVGDILGIFTSSTSEKHCTITLSSCGIGDGIKKDQIDRSGINRLNDPKPPVGNIDKQIDSNKSGIEYKTYPPDLSFSSYKIEFQFGEYVRPYFGENTTTPTRFKPTYIVQLPLPPQLSDAQSLGWQNANFGLTGLGIDTLTRANQKIDYSSVANAAASVVKSVGNMNMGTALGVAEIAGAIAGTYAQRVLGNNLAAGISGALGYAMNPFPGAFYVGPELRAFQFSWIFVPESAEEMSLIKGITNQIRRRTLSEPTTQFGEFLKYPEICKIKLYPDNLSRVFPIQECALTGINIDYAPYGLSFHTDKNPTAIGLGLVFGEIRPLFKTDFLDDVDEITVQELKQVFPKFTPEGRKEYSAQ